MAGMMQLSDDNYYAPQEVRFIIDGENKQGTMYTYEGVKALYDVIVFNDGSKVYRQNGFTVDKAGMVHAAMEYKHGI